MAKGMNTPVGMYSSKTNPLPKASEVASKFGPGMNADQSKANRLLQEAHQERSSLRGKSGM